MKLTTATRQQLMHKTGHRIYTGPFIGMKVPKDNRLVDVEAIQKLLGVYESGWHPAIESMLNRSTEHIVFVGGNTGYMCCGLAYILQPSRFDIYETQKSYHELLDLWFAENFTQDGVRTLQHTQYGTCSHKNFAAYNDTPPDLVFLDCEGFEDTLMNQSEYPWQANADFLIEAHNTLSDGVLGKICKKFKRTHHIKLYGENPLENQHVDNILTELIDSFDYKRSPHHRWTQGENGKQYSSGMWVYLTAKNK